MLALDRHGVIVVPHAVVRACRTSFQPVAGIDLDARLGRIDLQQAAGRRLGKFGGQLDLAGRSAVDDETVVISLAILQGRERGLDVPSEGLGDHEVHGCARHRLAVPHRNQVRIRGQVLRSVEAQHMVQRTPLTLQVEINMVGQVHHRRGIALRSEGEFQLAVVRPDIVRDDLQGAGIAGFPVFGEIHELHGIVHDAALPDLVLEAVGAAVQVVFRIVDRERVFLPVQGEMAAGDAVGVASGALAGAGAVAEIRGGVGIAQHDIGQFSVLVGHIDPYDGGSDRAQFDISAGGVRHRVFIDFLSVRGRTPQSLFDVHTESVLVF